MKNISLAKFRKVTSAEKGWARLGGHPLGGKGSQDLGSAVVLSDAAITINPK